MNENRENFLNIWSKYPAAPDGCLSLQRRALLSEIPESYLLGGALEKFTSDEIVISSKSIQLEFEIDFNKKFEQESIDFFRIGDHVTLSINCEKVLEIQLMSPRLENVKLTHKKFDYQRATDWNLFVSHIREFFNKNAFTEVSTPSLVKAPGSEPHLDVFETEFIFGILEEKCFLPTSPELHLKKMLADGWTDIYEIKKCFRNEEVSEHHEPEFWMLEFYRAFANLSQLENDFISLFKFLYEKKWLDNPIEKFQKFTVSELFKTHLNFDLNPNTTKEDLINLTAQNSIEVGPHFTWNDLYFLLFIEFIEPKICAMEGPIMISHFPGAQAALARKDDKGWSTRFEIYFKGLEIANAYDELTHPIEQLERCRDEVNLRKQLSKPSLPLDEQFLDSLKYGMPPSAGVAAGLERLFMALNNIKTIQELRPFSRG